MVRLRDTEDEATLRNAFRVFFHEQSPPSVVRRAEPVGHDAELWTRLTDVGALDMGVPASAGGGGASFPDLVIVAEELGRVVAPVALVEHQIATEALARFAPDQFADVLGAATIATIALRPAVDGRWRTVPGAAVAPVVVGVDGDRLVAMRHDAPGSTRANLGSQALSDVSAGPDPIVLDDASAHVSLADAWRVLTASALVGLAEAALCLGTKYVMQRRQFGVPIGSFQALQHGLADIPGMIEGARLLVGKAAWAREIHRAPVVDLAMNDIADERALASMALLFASDTAAYATDRVLHCHGGYGCAEEYDIQLYYRRARSWPLALGARRGERRHLADLLLGSAESGMHD